MNGHLPGCGPYCSRTHINPAEQFAHLIGHDVIVTIPGEPVRRAVLITVDHYGACKLRTYSTTTPGKLSHHFTYARRHYITGAPMPAPATPETDPVETYLHSRLTEDAAFGDTTAARSLLVLEAAAKMDNPTHRRLIVDAIALDYLDRADFPTRQEAAA